MNIAARTIYDKRLNPDWLTGMLNNRLPGNKNVTKSYISVENNNLRLPSMGAQWEPVTAYVYAIN